jgi:repressor LexA
MSMGLTHRESETLAFLREYVAANNGAAPSFDDVKDHLGLKSKSGIHRLLTALEERGLIRRISKRARAIEIIDRSVVICPHCGHVAGSAKCRAAASLEQASRENCSQTIPIATLAGATLR